MKILEVKNGIESACSSVSIGRIFDKDSVLKAVDSLRRKYYWEIRSALAIDYANLNISRMSYSNCTVDYDGMLVMAFRESAVAPIFCSSEFKDYVSERNEILQGRKRSLAEVRFPFVEFGKEKRGFPSINYNFTFIFSTEEQLARYYYNKGRATYSFTSPDDFEFEGIYISSFEKRKVPLSLSKGHHFSEVNDKFIASTTAGRIIQATTPLPDANCDQAVQEVKRIGNIYGIDGHKIETLSKAIVTYATFCKPKPIGEKDYAREVGRCFDIPLDFSAFCKERFNLDSIGTAKYQLGKGDGIYFYHQANLIGKHLVVDWTAKQYPNLVGEPYPFVYEKGSTKIPQKWGEMSPL